RRPHLDSGRPLRRRASLVARWSRALHRAAGRGTARSAELSSSATAGRGAAMTRGQARSALLFGALAVALIQVALNLALPATCPYLGDLEYQVRLDSTRKQLLAHPERPLAVVLGSSHALTGLCPAVFGPEAPFLLMNFGHTNSGPIVELLYL